MRVIRLFPHFGLRQMSLKARFGVGAAILGASGFATAMILWLGMSAVAERLETALATEQRMSRYATLSQQAARFLVIATEAVQTDLPPDTRLERIAPVAEQMRATFARVHAGIEDAVAEAAAIGLDQQSRFGTQSLGVARMEAMLARTLENLASQETDRARLRAHIDSFASAFDPLLNQAVNAEVLFRNEVLTGIEDLRRRLTLIALIIGALSVLAVGLFHFSLVRPQLRRLDGVREAAQRIGRAEFEVDLPVDRKDEIGELYRETNRMAAALQERQDAVEAEWRRLNETIEERTAELRAANAQLSEIDENRRRFFADVSHELRTPLTVILMEAQIGMKETGAPAFQTIESRAARLNRRIDDLLRVARSSSGQLALDPQPTTLRALVEAAVEETRAEVDNAGMTLALDMDDDDAPLTCDANWIRQVIVSLIRNALRHAREGGALKLVAGAEGGHAVVDVLDNGPGVEPEDQRTIFDRFVKGRGGASQGFGIGLALARWVVEAHDGEVRLQSPVPKAEALGVAPGAKVGLRLPVAPT